MQPKNQIKNAFKSQRRLRPWSVEHFGGMQAAKAHPVAACAFLPDEGGTTSTKLHVKLAPVSGFMRSNAYVQVTQVLVPYQAMEASVQAAHEDRGVTEMSRRRLLAGLGLGLEAENIISKACYVHPVNDGTGKKVSRLVADAYNCAVNHMRKLAYYDAAQVHATSRAIQPATLTANILQRMNGVLDPERLIDGAINLSGELPVKGIYEIGDDTHSNEATEISGDGTTLDPAGIWRRLGWTPAGGDARVDLSGTSEITLRDLMESRKLDELVRGFADIVQKDPINGEEAVARALYGLSCNFDDRCHVLYDQTHEIRPQHSRPMDGASFNDVNANFELSLGFSTVVPRMELGGIAITLVSVKPMEVLDQQPDPILTQKWGLVNRVHDELALDEVLLTRGQLESNVAPADKDTPAFWVGHNALKHEYHTQGPNVQQTTGVEMQSSMWTYNVPTSVTPANVVYPATINMYPFYNWNGSHAEYSVRQVAAISTHLAKGPNPVERIQLFADDPALVDPDL